MRVHLFDGTYELFRAWFGAPAARTPDGREVGATRALARSLASLLRRGAVTHGAVAFDHVIESFRNRLFPGYKTSEGLEPDLLAQFPLAEAVTGALGLAVWPMVEFEADDALATAAHQLAADARVDEIVIASPDKDLAQCVRGQRVLRWDRVRDHWLDEDGVRARFGAGPSGVPDWLALVGDTADGIPGLPGFGEKTASALLGRYGSLEGIPAEPERWDPKVRGASRLAATLRKHREAVRLYRELATLRVDVPLAATPEALVWRGVRPEALRALEGVLGPPEVERFLALAAPSAAL